MKFLLVAINAKYIHSNLAVYSLKAYAEKYLGKEYLDENEIEIAEYTINRYENEIIADIYERKPDVLTFSCYIWNIEYVTRIMEDIRKILPDVPIWLGGPEVSYNSSEVLKKYPYVKGILRGEGEEIFKNVVRACIDNSKQKPNKESGRRIIGKDPDDYARAMEPVEYIIKEDDYLRSIPGITYRESGDGYIIRNDDAGIVDMSSIPFVYENLKDFENRIIYYESSRGCPFSCSYCLSSIDKNLRFRDLELVKKELKYFLDNKTAQVKFVDRTFNCKRSHADEIWRFIKENDNGVTNFHFEIAADLMTDEEIDLISTMRSGLVQLEIGIQTTNPNTISLIDRKMDFEKVSEVVEKLKMPRNIHLHLDLIAGLPKEDIASFINSFNMVYALKPDELQLGFLKVLHGSKIEKQIEENDMVYSSYPPYEVLSTKWIGYDDILRLKRVEEVLEIYYNSGQFKHTILELEKFFLSPFEMYDKLGYYYKEHSPNGESHSRIRRYELLLEFYKEEVCAQFNEKTLNMQSNEETICRETTPEKDGSYDRPETQAEIFRQLLVLDVYLRDNIKSRPTFASDMSGLKKQINEFYINEEKERRYLPGYEQYNSKQLAGLTHIEWFDFDIIRYCESGEYIPEGVLVLFDYKNRSPLDHSAKIIKIDAKI